MLPFLYLLIFVVDNILSFLFIFFFFQAEDGIRDYKVTGVQTCALPISCVSYLLDDTTGEALWLTDERALAPSTRRLLPATTVREPDARLSPWAAPAQAGPAPRLALAAPQIEVLAERAGEAGRVLSLRLRSRRRAPWLYVTADAGVQAARIVDGLNDIALPASPPAS